MSKETKTPLYRRDETGMAHQPLNVYPNLSTHLTEEPYYSAAHSSDGKDFDSHYALFPIPQSFIEANTGNPIEQNPGY